MSHLPHTPAPSRNPADELLAVVDSTDTEIGAEPRALVHARGLWHRAVHVLIFSSDHSRILIQQRSSLKDTFPLQWECVGGHLGPGEAYSAAAEREVLEELGAPATELFRLGKVAACEITGWEFIEVYRATLAGDPSPDPAEVIALEWLTPDALRDEIARHTRAFSPTFVNTLDTLRVLAT